MLESCLRGGWDGMGWIGGLVWFGFGKKESGRRTVGVMEGRMGD